MDQSVKASQETTEWEIEAIHSTEEKLAHSEDIVVITPVLFDASRSDILWLET